MPALKCPSPSCPFLFDPAQVPAGAVLTCPRCGMRFTLGPSDAAPPPPPPGSQSVETSRRPARLPSTTDRGGPSFLTVITVVGMVATVVAGGVLLVRSLPGKPTATGDEAPFPDMNCAYRVPPDPWAKDAALMRSIGANLIGLKRADPEVYAAVAVTDFKTRNPQPGELTSGLEDRLKRMFDEPTIEPEGDGTWAGQPAKRVRFRGLLKGQPGAAAVFAGEGYAIAFRSIGYWFFGWAPEAGAADAAADFADLRDRFRLLDGRADFKETTTAFSLIAGRAASYRLQDADRWWSEPPGADAKSDEDDKQADLLFRAEFRGQRRIDSPPKATLVTYVLPASDDPSGTVREHVKARYDRLYGKSEWTELTDPPQGDPPLGAGPAPEVGRFRVDAKSLGRPMLVVLSAIDLTGGKKVVVGAEAYCPWGDRGRWESRLVYLVGSLRAGK